MRLSKVFAKPVLAVVKVLLPVILVTGLLAGLFTLAGGVESAVAAGELASSAQDDTPSRDTCSISDEWVWRNPLPQGNDLFDIIWDGNNFIAVGGAGTILNSHDGVAWTVSNSGTSNILRGITWSGSQFVVVGNSGTILTSPDGISWSERFAGTTNTLNDITWGNNTFVAVGTGGIILTSSDGVNWTSPTSVTTNTLNSITWGNNMFVVVGDSGNILTSSDGVTWTNLSSGSSALYGIAWGNNLFVGVGAGGAIRTSTNGVSWSESTSGTATFYSITWGNNQFVAVGTSGKIVTSLDGTTWTERTSPNTSQLNNITWGGNQFVVVGPTGTLLISQNGENWTARNSGITRTLWDTTWTGNQFVVVGATGTILTSTDEESWTESVSGKTVTLMGVSYGNNTFVTVGASSVILTSSDGITWTERTSPYTSQLNSITWGGNQFVAVGANGRIITSPTGETWTARTIYISNSLSDVTWSGSQFVAVGGMGTIRTSPDGIDWTTRSSGTSNSLNSVIWGDNKFVAVGASGTILTSPDGIVWTQSTSGTANLLYNVIWGNSQFIAVGSGGTIITSQNGISWTTRRSDTTRTFYSTTWNGDQFLTVGFLGTILSAGPLPVLTVQSSNPASGVAITSSTGHGGETGYAQLTDSCSEVNLAAPDYIGSGADTKRFTGWSGSVNSINPSINFVMDGDKTVTANYVDAPIPPTAAFVADPTSGSAPLVVQFTNGSTDDPAGWAWYFGDEEFDEPWVQQTANGGWQARDTHASVVLPDGSIVLMGGNTTSWSPTLMRDVWRSTNQGATWTQITANAGWSARYGHSSLALPDGTIVLMGGKDSSGYKNDVWHSTDKGATWTQVTASAPWAGRFTHTSELLPDGSIVLMGGDSGSKRNDVWRSTDNGATWSLMAASAGWTGRYYHASEVLPDGSIIVMGGFDGSGRNDVWRSTDKGATWTELTAAAEFSARMGHTSAVLPDGSIILMGGASGGRRNDVWRSADQGATWTEITSGAEWIGRNLHTSVVLPDGSIMVMGGINDSDPQRTNDAWRWETAGSYEQHPEHTYTAAGTYPVTLQAYNAGGVSTLSKPGYIQAIMVLEGAINGPVLLDRPVKVLLKDGTVISGGGPCFDVRADNVQIDAESPGGAVCNPGSPGIVVADGTTDFRVRGLTIDGQGAEDTVGILFEGAISGVIVNDIIFRNLTGDALHFTEPPGGFVEIKGNLFLMDGLAVNVPDLDVDFNAWGSITGPAAGDLPEGYVVADWTHVDIYLEYAASSRYADEVALSDVPPEAITYHVYANLENALGAQFTLTFDPTYLSVLSTDTTGTVFPWPFDDPGYGGTALTQGVTVDGDKITFNGAATAPVSGPGQFLFSITFSGVSSTATNNPLSFEAEDEALFGMSPGYGASLNIYAAKLLGVDDVNVYTLPTLAIAPLEHYAAGNPKEFTLTVTNPFDGRGYDELVVYLDVPFGAQLQVWSDNLGRFVAYPAATGVVIGTLDPDYFAEARFRITFSSAGLVGVPVTLNDSAIFLVEDAINFNVLPAHTVTGSVQMQGRMDRSGVSIELYNQDQGMGDYVYAVISIDLLTGNFTFTHAAQGSYWITFIQDRYLDLTLALEKGFNLTSLLQLARLELRGGDLNNSGEVDIFDASILGTHYGATGDSPGDANFDGKVNIQDLAMIGGNFDLTSAAAYAGWTP